MSDDLKGKLDRLSERVDDPAGAFDRLRARRARQERTRRVATIALVALIAVTTTGWLLSTRGGPNATPGATATSSAGAPWTAPKVLTVWPENPLGSTGTAEEAQQAADAGDLEWRLDPREVANHFAHTFMGWDDPNILPFEPSDNYLDVDITPCGPNTDCGANVDVLGLRLVQPAERGVGGVWSVAAVTTERLDLGVDPDQTLTVDQSLHPKLARVQGEALHIGSITQSSCGLETNLMTDTAPGTLLDVAGSIGCSGVQAGYVFAYTTPSDLVAVGDPLNEAGDIWTLSMVPVYVVDTAGSNVPDVAIVECDGATTMVTTPVVAAQPDGVHLEIRNTSDADLGIQFESTGDNADRGTSRLVSPLEPGTNQARCQRPEEDAGAPGGWASFQVIDPNGYWVSPHLAGNSCSSSAIDYVPGAQGFEDPLAAARSAGSVRDGDELEAAGYPAAPDGRSFLVIRDGVPVALVRLERASGGWLVAGEDTCS